MRWTEWFGWIWGILAKSVACGSSLARKALAAEDHQSRAPAVYFHLSAPPAGAAHGHLGPPADSAQGYHRSPRTTFGQLGFGFDSLKSHQFHKPPDISDKIQTMDIQMFFLEMSLISLSALHNLNWAQLIADSSLKWSHIFFSHKDPKSEGSPYKRISAKWFWTPAPFSHILTLSCISEFHYFGFPGSAILRRVCIPLLSRFLRSFLWRSTDRDQSGANPMICLHFSQICTLAKREID